MQNQTTSPSILLTIDVEDWFQVENFKQSISFSSWSSRELRVEQNTHRLLNLFDSIKISPKGDELRAIRYGLDSNSHSHPKATFFILGWIAERTPNLIREIHSRGHEIASHGIYHNLPNDYSSQDYQVDLSDSRKMLEDIIGERVFGYRAPSFAINEGILKLVQSAGYAYDSSYNSFAVHERYGRVDLAAYAKNGSAIRLFDTFYELPISNLLLGNKVIPWGGGGYFRLLPFSIFKLGMKSILKKDGAYIFYMHPWEIDPGQPRVKNAPYFYKFRHYINLSSTYSKLYKLLSDFNQHRFYNCTQYLNAINSITLTSQE